VRGGGFLARLRGILRTRRFDPQEHPFGIAPHADRETYLRLHSEAQAVEYPAVDQFEREQGFRIDRNWMEQLALHTQVVIKESRLNYQHGRVLYAAAREYLARRGGAEPVTMLETGTARGFSAVCLARAIMDAGAGSGGRIITIDVLPHDRPMLWNCIDDHEGPKTRQELLAPWSEELQRIVFIQGSTRIQLDHLGIAHIGFAFLDASHSQEDVMLEFQYVSGRQERGDVVVFDDVTPGTFDGVVEAVAAIEREGRYAVTHLRSSSGRGYAIALRR
jgi:predicted O-methyltransferase YrrM